METKLWAIAKPLYHALTGADSEPLVCMKVCYWVSRGRLFATPWAVACQASLPMGYSSQEYWSGLPCPPPGDLPTQGWKPGLLHLLFCRRILYCWATSEACLRGRPSFSGRGASIEKAERWSCLSSQCPGTTGLPNLTQWIFCQDRTVFCSNFWLPSRDCYNRLSSPNSSWNILGLLWEQQGGLYWDLIIYMTLRNALGICCLISCLQKSLN